MLALIKLPLKTNIRTVLDSDFPVQIKFDQGMASRHNCPCCSSVLLRHFSQGNMYWRCSYCRAAMAVWAQL
jgi:hypothetical protein